MRATLSCCIALLAATLLAGCGSEKPPVPSLEEQTEALQGESPAMPVEHQAAAQPGAEGDPDAPGEASKTAEPRFSGRLERMDADKDGTISKAEFTGGAEEFARIDVDGDGAITPHEAAETPSLFAVLADSLDQWDSNGDGVLSMEEWDSVFNRLDADADRSLDRDELRQADGDPQARMILEHFSHFDGRDRDGNIVIEEWGLSFARIDRGETDGKATREEIEAAIGRRGSRGDNP